MDLPGNEEPTPAVVTAAAASAAPSAPPAAPAPPAPPALWPLALIFAGTVGLLFAGGLVAAVFAVAATIASGTLARGADPDEIRAAIEAQLYALPGLLFSAMLVSPMIGAAGAISARLLDRRPLRLSLRLGPAAVSGWIVAAMAVGGTALSEAMGAFLMIFELHVGSNVERIAQALATAQGGWLIAAIVLIGLFPGVCEELFFRGFFQTRLRLRLARWPAILITSAAFALIHFDVVHSGVTLLFGLYLGWITEASGSIRPAIALHVLNNTSSVLSASLITDPTQQVLLVDLLVSGSLGLGVLGFLVVYLRRSAAAGLPALAPAPAVGGQGPG